MRKLRYLLLLFVLITLSTVASTPNGTISGLVAGPDGAAVASAQITITEMSTNEKHGTTRVTDGRCIVPFISPGTYVVSVDAHLHGAFPRQSSYHHF
jgi:hypothetical protein